MTEAILFIHVFKHFHTMTILDVLEFLFYKIFKKRKIFFSCCREKQK